MVASGVGGRRSGGGPPRPGGGVGYGAALPRSGARLGGRPRGNRPVEPRSGRHRLARGGAALDQDGRDPQAVSGHAADRRRRARAGRRGADGARGGPGGRGGPRDRADAPRPRIPAGRGGGREAAGGGWGGGGG